VEKQIRSTGKFLKGKVKIVKANELENRPTNLKLERKFRWVWWFIIFIIFLTVVIPTLQAFWIRHQVLSFVDSAQSVRLEAFSRFARPPKIITVELNAEQRKAIASAMPIVPDIGIPFLEKLCFVPHHRLIARGADGKEFVFLICFGCDQVKINDGMILGMPFLWDSSLRNLFTEYKIPLQVSDF
jgi:hypothetical protein